MPEPSDDTPLEHALAYALEGIRVIPIKPGGKYPAGFNRWQDEATVDPDIIREWWTGRFRSYGVGLALGPQPDGSNLFALDLDEHNPSASGSESLTILEDTYGKLPETVSAITGSNGAHRLYRAPVDVDLRNSAGNIAPGIDIRGAGGQIVVAPTIHPDTGNAYQWEHGYAPWEHAIADAPPWLVELAVPTPPEPKPARISAAYRPDADDDPADIIRAGWDWTRELAADGWQLHHTDRATGDTHWTRPGKSTRQGSSGVLHEPNGPFVVFSTDPALAAHRNAGRPTPAGGVALSPFAFYAARNHGGDMSAAGRSIRAAMTPALSPSSSIAPPHRITLGDVVDPTAAELIAAYNAADIGQTDDLLGLLVNWETFWTADHSTEDWLLEPLIAAHRGHSIFAPGGTGKSLLALWLAAQAATGGPALDGEPRTPLDVLYLDYEMTGDDLYERLDNMGYGPEADLTKLHYALLPSLEGLDTPAGGQTVARLAELVDAQLVVFDTFGRAVVGDENDADTVRAFYRYTGLALKAAGRAFVRVDHAGKDIDKGQRGSSAKNDDVDVVWRLAGNPADGYTAAAKKRRMSWVPETVKLTLLDEPTRFLLADGHTSPAGTAAVIRDLDELDVPLDAGRPAARAALKAAGRKARNDALAAALRHRRNRGDSVRDSANDRINLDERDSSGQSDKTPAQKVRTAVRTARDSTPAVSGDSCPSLERGNGPTDPDQPDEWNPFA